MKFFLSTLSAVTLFLSNHALAHFNDVLSTHQHYTAIEYVEGQGLVSGYGDQTFRPDQTINRVEFLKILLEAKLSSAAVCQTTYTYTDVEWNSWYSAYVQLASCRDIVEGYADRKALCKACEADIQELLNHLRICQKS